MANEIKMGVTLKVDNGTYSDEFVKVSRQFNQAAQGAVGGIQTIGDTAEALNTGDLTTEGVLALHNLDSVAWVSFGPDLSGSQITVGRINPGEFCLFRTEPAVQLDLTAQSGSVKVQYLWLED